MEDYIVVLGGATVDISAYPYKELVYQDSNPGYSKLSLGGVARNIAENLARMGKKVKLISAIGDDFYGDYILSQSKLLNIDTEASLIIKGGKSPSYLCINDQQGDMELAVSDMELNKEISPDFLSSKLDLINKAQAIVLDTNYSIEAIDYILKNAKIPIFLDTVSTAKTRLMVDRLKGINTISPNLLEAEILTGLKLDSREKLEEAAGIIHEKSVKNVFITLGKDGIFYSDGRSSGILASLCQEIVNTTGAGDSLLAGIVYGFLEGMDIENQALLGSIASSINLKSIDTVSKDMTEENLLNLYKQIKEDKDE